MYYMAIYRHLPQIVPVASRIMISYNMRKKQTQEKRIKRLLNKWNALSEKTPRPNPFCWGKPSTQLWHFSVGLVQIPTSINNINLSAALINRPISDPFNGNRASGTTIRLTSLSVDHGHRSPSKSQQRFITAKERYSPEESTGVWTWEYFLPGLSVQVSFCWEFPKFAKKYSRIGCAITYSTAKRENRR